MLPNPILPTAHAPHPRAPDAPESAADALFAPLLARLLGAHGDEPGTLEQAARERAARAKDPTPRPDDPTARARQKLTSAPRTSPAAPGPHGPADIAAQELASPSKPGREPPPPGPRSRGRETDPHTDPQRPAGTRAHDPRAPRPEPSSEQTPQHRPQTHQQPASPAPDTPTNARPGPAPAPSAVPAQANQVATQAAQSAAQTSAPRAAGPAIQVSAPAAPARATPGQPTPRPAPAAQRPPAPHAHNQRLLALHRAAFVNQVKGGLASILSERGGSVTLRLEPHSLGQMRIHLQMSKGEVAARFEVSTPQARQLLESSLDTLRSALEARGLSVQRLNVETSGAEQPRAEHPGQHGRDGPGAKDGDPDDQGTTARDGRGRGGGPRGRTEPADARGPDGAEPQSQTLADPAEPDDRPGYVYGLRLDTIA